MNETCLILGDSIAVGLASVIKGCVVVAKVGMSSTWIMANAPTMQADRVYISSGSNDPDNPALSANLEHTRAKIGGVIRTGECACGVCRCSGSRQAWRSCSVVYSWTG